MNKLHMVGGILFGAGSYILLPTPDEAFIYPCLGSLYSAVFDVTFVQGLGISILVYRGLGIVCLLGALLFGRKRIYQKLKTRFIKRNRTEFNT